MNMRALSGHKLPRMELNVCLRSAAEVAAAFGAEPSFGIHLVDFIHILFITDRDYVEGNDTIGVGIGRYMHLQIEGGRDADGSLEGMHHRTPRQEEETRKDSNLQTIWSQQFSLQRNHIDCTPKERETEEPNKESNPGPVPAVLLTERKVGTRLVLHRAEARAVPQLPNPGATDLKWLFQWLFPGEKPSLEELQKAR